MSPAHDDSDVPDRDRFDIPGDVIRGGLSVARPKLMQDKTFTPALSYHITIDALGNQVFSSFPRVDLYVPDVVTAVIEVSKDGGGWLFILTDPDDREILRFRQGTLLGQMGALDDVLEKAIRFYEANRTEGLPRKELVAAIRRIGKIEPSVPYLLLRLGHGLGSDKKATFFFLLPGRNSTDYRTTKYGFGLYYAVRERDLYFGDDYEPEESNLWIARLVIPKSQGEFKIRVLSTKKEYEFSAAD